MSSQMNQHRDFATSLNGWATVPTAAAEAVKTWDTAAALIVDNPVPDLRTDVYNGKIGPKNILKRLSEASLILAGQFVAPKLVEEIDAPLSLRFADAILVNGDSIIAELSVQFDRYAAQIVQYAPLVAPGTTAEELLSMANSEVLQAWQGLGVAETVLDQVAQFRAQLSTRYDYPAPSPEVSAWIAPVSNGTELRRAVLTWRGHQPIGGVDDGATIALPDARGGRWRHLVDAGFTLACNDQHQAANVASVLTSVAA